MAAAPSLVTSCFKLLRYLSNQKQALLESEQQPSSCHVYTAQLATGWTLCHAQWWAHGWSSFLDMAWKSSHGHRPFCTRSIDDHACLEKLTINSSTVGWLKVVSRQAREVGKYLITHSGDVWELVAEQSNHNDTISSPVAKRGKCCKEKMSENSIYLNLYPLFLSFVEAILHLCKHVTAADSLGVSCLQGAQSHLFITAR